MHAELRKLSSIFKRTALFGVAFVGFLLTIVGTCAAQVEIYQPPSIPVVPVAPPIQLQNPSYSIPSSPPVSLPPAVYQNVPAGGASPSIQERAEGGDCEVAKQNCDDSDCFPLDTSRWSSYRECINAFCKIESENCLEALIKDLREREQENSNR